MRDSLPEEKTVNETAKKKKKEKEKRKKKIKFYKSVRIYVMV